MFRIFALLIGYGFGLFQTGYILSRVLYNIDIRQHGSKSAGMTNVNRTINSKAAAVVFFVDVLKAAAAFVVASLLFDGGGLFLGEGCVLPGLYAGLGAILGHNFPFYLRFKGGKGISCTLGVMLMSDWRMALITFLLGLILVIVFRYISVASLAMTLVMPLLLTGFGRMIEVVAVFGVICASAWVLHRANILRLWRGEESKFRLKL